MLSYTTIAQTTIDEARLLLPLLLLLFTLRHGLHQIDNISDKVVWKEHFAEMSSSWGPVIGQKTDKPLFHDLMINAADGSLQAHRVLSPRLPSLLDAIMFISFCV